MNITWTRNENTDKGAVLHLLTSSSKTCRFHIELVLADRPILDSLDYFLDNWQRNKKPFSRLNLAAESIG